MAKDAKDEGLKWLKSHQEHIKGQTFRKYGGVPDSTGKVHDLKGKGLELARKINSPKAKEKRMWRGDRHEGHENRFGMRRLAELNHKK